MAIGWQTSKYGPEWPYASRGRVGNQQFLSHQCFEVFWKNEDEALIDKEATLIIHRIALIIKRVALDSRRWVPPSARPGPWNRKLIYLRIDCVDKRRFRMAASKNTPSKKIQDYSDSRLLRFKTLKIVKFIGGPPRTTHRDFLALCQCVWPAFLLGGRTYLPQGY